jgi:hypothetical protein
MSLLDELKQEVVELQNAIKVLERRGGPRKSAAKSPKSLKSPKSPKPAAHGRVWSAADRKRMSLRVKAALAAKKKGK